MFRSPSPSRRCRAHKSSSRSLNDKNSRKLCGFTRPPIVEPLEERTLLTAGSLADLAIVTSLEQLNLDPALASEVRSMNWNGQSSLAMAGEWIVQFDSSVSGARSLRIEDYQQTIATSLAGFELVSNLGQAGTFLLRCPSEATFEEISASLATHGIVARIEPNFVVTTTATIPNDPRFNDLYGMHNTGQFGGVVDADIDAPEAWDITTGSGQTVVGVIDTGVDYTHPDLVDNMWINPGEIASNLIDDDGNGFVDDIYGWDFVHNDADPYDGHGHGTHVSGTIGAVGDNGVGVAGVLWDVQIMALRFLDDFGFGDNAGAISAVNYATMMKRDFSVNVVATNNSWGNLPFSQILEDAIVASGQEDILFVAAAGNSSRNTDFGPFYPANYAADNIISVAALDRYDNLANFSNYGAATVDLGAPGVDTLSTTPFNTYSSYSGTSMASPHVAGVVAMLYDLNSNASYQQIRDAIFNSVDPVGSLAGITVTGGRLNALNAIQQMSLRVVDADPADGEVVQTPPVSFDVILSAAPDLTTVDAADFSVNGIPADSVNVNGNTLTFGFAVSPVTVEGPQTAQIAADAILRSLDGDGIDAYQAIFRFDLLSLAVVQATPDGSSIVSLPLTTIRLDFNETVDVNSIGTDDLTLNRGSVAAFQLIDADTIEYTLADIDDDRPLSVTLAAGALTDPVGNPNVSFSTTLTLDTSETAIGPFERSGPLGGLILTAPIDLGHIHDSADIDEFVIDITAGESVAVLATPSNLLSTLEIELVGMGPVVTAPGPGQNVRIGPTFAAADGQVRIRVRSDSPTDYSLRVVRNAAILEPNFFAPTDITNSSISFNNLRRYAAVGDVQPSNYSVSRISFDASLGRPVDILVSGLGGLDLSGGLVYLYDSNGSFVASGFADSSDLSPAADLSIRGLVPTESGLYTMYVYAPSSGSYALVVTAAGQFELEGNDPLSDPLRSLNPVTAVLGYAGTQPLEGAANFQIDASLSSLTLSGTITESTSGLVIPAFEQASGSLTAALQGTLSAAFFDDLIQISNATHIDFIADAGPFLPGSSPADYAAQASLGVLNLYAAVRDVFVTAYGFPSLIDSSGQFNVQNTTFEILQGLASIDAGPLGTGTFNISGYIDDNSPTELGTIVEFGSDLVVTVPINIDLEVQIPDTTFVVIAKLSGVIVGTTPAPSKEDGYQLTLTAGQQIDLATQTPFATALGSDLDPSITVLDALGNILASDDNSGAGGNAALTFVAPADGVYRIVVGATAGSGEYALLISGSNASNPLPFNVLSTTPFDGQVVPSAVTEIIVNFNNLIDAATLDASDLTYSGIAATGVELLDATTARFFVAATTEGPWQINIAAGAISDVYGAPVASFSSSFDTELAPRVLFSSIQEGDILTAGDLTYFIRFDDVVDGSVIDTSDVTLFANGSGNSYTPDSVAYNPAGSVLVANFSALPEDFYRLTVRSGFSGIRDLLGSSLDGEPFAFPLPPNISGDGFAGGDFFVNFELDQVIAPFPVPLTPLAPAGSMVYEGLTNGRISTASDVDAFTIDLDPSQVVSILVDGADTLRSHVRVYAPGGSLLAQSQAAAAGDLLWISAISASSAGTYRIEVEGVGTTTGAYTLQVLANAIFEDESLGGTGNGDVANAQSLDPAAIALVPNIVSQSLTQNGSVYYPNVLTYTFNGLATPAGSATLQFDVNADLGSSFEYLDIVIDGVNMGRIFEFDGGEGTFATTTLNLSVAQIQQFASDGSMVLTATPSFDVNDFGFSFLTVTLSYGAGGISQASAVGTSDSLDSDVYSFSMLAGESAALTVASIGDATIELLNSSGVVLALTNAVGTDAVASIANFMAPADGTYYARVVGSDYQLTLTTNAAFDLGVGGDFASAIDITQSGAVVGAAGASSGGTSAGTPVFLGTTLLDSEGFIWDILGDGSILNGTFDAYDVGMDNQIFPSFSQGLAEDSGREIVIGAAALAGASVTRKVYIPNDQAFARFLEIVTNSTSSTLHLPLLINTDLGSDGFEPSLSTSSGDNLFTTADNWIVTDDGNFGDPAVTHVIAGDGAQRPTAVSYLPGRVDYGYFLTLAPGETQIVMHFAAQSSDFATGLVKANDLVALNREALAGMSQGELSSVVNFALPPSERYYSILANAGDHLSIRSRTPFGGPFEIQNDLDPIIELYDASGNLIATDDNSAADGRNAVILATATATGRYVIKMSGAPGTSGEFVLEVQGSTANLTPLQIVSTDPIDGATATLPSTFTVTLSEAVLVTSVDAGDLLVGGVAATSATILDPTTIQFQLPALADGNHTVAIAAGAFQSFTGSPVEAFSSSLKIDQTSPTVTEVLVSSSAWNSSFLNALNSLGLGQSGYRVPTGSGQQLTTLPWVNLDRIIIRFSEDVTVNESDLALAGLAVSDYGFAPGGFHYDQATFTATWTVAAADLHPSSHGFMADRLLVAMADTVTDGAGNPLDGEWSNPSSTSSPTSDLYPSGDGAAGGDFHFRFNVLPGDINGNGQVLGNDLLAVRNTQFRFPGNPGYSVLRDVNGSGGILGDDVLLVRGRQFATLPAGEPVAPASAAAFASTDGAEGGLLDLLPHSLPVAATIQEESADAGTADGAEGAVAALSSAPAKLETDALTMASDDSARRSLVADSNTGGADVLGEDVVDLVLQDMDDLLELVHEE